MAKDYRQLSIEERSVVMVGLAEGLSRRAIARLLERSPSTISREVERNAGRWEFRRYSAPLATSMTQRRRRINQSKFKQYPALWRRVQAELRSGWSPQQIAGRLRRMKTDDPDQAVSHETIYAAIYAQPRGELRTNLIKALRQSRKKRRPRSRGQDRRGQLKDITPIAQRPPDVETRKVSGHWEGDLIKGKGNKSAVGSLVERTSRYTILVQLDDATAPVTHQGFVRQMMPVPELLRLSLTYDRGREMACHKELAADLSLTVYFADPYAPWQRGTNENTNGLVRQFLPKGIDLSPYSQDDLNEIASLLNNRPRKTLGFQTPAEVYSQIIAGHDKENSSVALHP
jgi:IS30 family transposase